MLAWPQLLCSTVLSCSFTHTHTHTPNFTFKKHQLKGCLSSLRSKHWTAWNGFQTQPLSSSRKLLRTDTCTWLQLSHVHICVLRIPSIRRRTGLARVFLHCKGRSWMPKRVLEGEWGAEGLCRKYITHTQFCGTALLCSTTADAVQPSHKYSTSLPCIPQAGKHRNGSTARF